MKWFNGINTLAELRRTYRKELKALGFHWAKQKQIWYKHFDDFHKFSSKPASMSYIRAKYGSVEIRFQEMREEREKLTKA